MTTNERPANTPVLLVEPEKPTLSTYNPAPGVQLVELKGTRYAVTFIYAADIASVHVFTDGGPLLSFDLDAQALHLIHQMCATVNPAAFDDRDAT